MFHFDKVISKERLEAEVRFRQVYKELNAMGKVLYRLDTKELISEDEFVDTMFTEMEAEGEFYHGSEDNG